MARPQHQNYFDRKLRVTTGYAARLLELQLKPLAVRAAV